MYSDVDNRGFKAILNSLLFIIIYFVLLHPAFAANELDNWNGNVSKEIRQNINNNPTTTYKELKIQDATPSQISGKYSDATTAGGSKAGITIDALKVPVNKAQVAKDLAVRYGKAAGKLAGGAVLSYVGSEAIKQLIDGIGWLIDEGGVIKKHSSLECKSDGSDCQSSEHLYSRNVTPKKYYNSVSSAITEYQKTFDDRTFSGTSCSLNSPTTYKCTFQVNFKNGNTLQSQEYIGFTKNPSYQKNSAPQVDTVSNQELENEVSKQLNNNPDSALSKKLTESAYTIQDSDGKPTESYAQADQTQGVNEAANSFKDAAKTAIADNTNVANAVITNSTVVNNTATSTSTNNQNTTVTNTTTNAKSELPKFCDYAAKLCEWMNWTQKDEPLKDDLKVEIKEIAPPVLNTNTFSATPGCPQPIPVNNQIGNKGTIYISYEPICQFASKWSFVAPLVGFFSGAMIIIGVGRKGEDSEV